MSTDLSSAPEGGIRRKNRVRWGRRRKAVAVVLVTLVGVVLVGSWRVSVLREQVQRGQAELSLALDLFSSKHPFELDQQDFSGMYEHLQVAGASLCPARDEISPWQPLLDMIGGDAQAALPLLDLACNGARAGQELYNGFKPLLTGESLIWQTALSVSGASHPEGHVRELLQQLLANRPYLVQARVHLSNLLPAYRRLQGVDRTRLSSLTAPSVARIDKYSSVLESIDSIAQTLTNSPDLIASLVGFDEPRTYLLLAHNNDELRPVGGYIGSFGLLVVQDGAIVVNEFKSTESPLLHSPDSPCPSSGPPWWLQLQEPVWGCWDAQWTADFPTLAGQVKWFYDQGENKYAPVDGVIALDQIGVRQLLEPLGSVSVPEYGETVTADTLRDRVYFYQGGGEQEFHKQFLSSVFKSILERNLTQLSTAQARGLVGALQDAIAQKHLLFYFNDPDLQKVISMLGADGAIRPSPGDYLLVVDTSLAGKVYNSIQQQIQYDVTLSDDGSAASQLRVDWTYPASAALDDPAISNVVRNIGRAPDLLDLTRVYLPPATLWSGTFDAPETGDVESTPGSAKPTYFGTEADLLMVGTRVDLAVGESGGVIYRYTMPGCVQILGDELAVAGGNTEAQAPTGTRYLYRLLVQKQAGIHAPALTVRITLPPGRELVSTVPAELVLTAPRVLEFRGTLMTDQLYELTFK